MIILALTPNDKGTQLEALTQRLLISRGYENCTTNVMANGAEIDVRGELPLPSLGPDRSQTLICECKAHKAVMDMTQWCKFLGKVYHQEVCEQAEVAGCFISLSGVNGHVQGNFDEIARHKKSIFLVHGDELIKLVAKLIPMSPLSEISHRIKSITDRTASRFEPAYRDGAVFWIVVLSGGEFSLFDAGGGFVDADVAAELTPMVESELNVAKYVDIRTELRAQQRASRARVFVVATLFELGGSIGGVDQFEQADDLTPQELQHAAQQLVDEGHLRIDDEGRCIVPTTATENGEQVAIELYRTIFSNVFPVRVLSSDFYQRHINRAMMDEICRIQGDLPLQEGDIDEIISLLQLSPTALVQVLTPLEMIVTGRERGVQNERVDRLHQAYFHRIVLEALRRDFGSSTLAEFFHEKKGMRELETSMKLILKSEERIVTETEFTERVGIGQAAESLGGRLIHVAMSPDVPQPWELNRATNEEDVPPSQNEGDA